MPLSKARMRERKRHNQGDYRIKVGKCSACHRISPINRHHPDYSKPLETIPLCVSCHKKVHLTLKGKQRKGSNPYINPLLRLGVA
jgi:hypothetical protein